MRLAHAEGDMPPSFEVEDEWILLSTAVARMSELNAKYRTYLGEARRDLETAIRAGRISLRGRLAWALDDPPQRMIQPITSRHRLDLIHDTLSERRPGPVGDAILLREVQLEWTGAAKYLRAFPPGNGKPARGAVVRPAGTAQVTGAMTGKRATGRRPEVLKRVKDQMRADIQAGNRTVAELQGLLQKELAAIYNASRDTVRKALRAIVSEFGENSFATNSGKRQIGTRF
jgi:hypothetical protein